MVGKYKLESSLKDYVDKCATAFVGIEDTFKMNPIIAILVPGTIAYRGIQALNKVPNPSRKEKLIGYSAMLGLELSRDAIGLGGLYLCYKSFEVTSEFLAHLH